MPEYVPRRTRKTPPKRGGKVWKQAVDLAYDLLVGRTRTEACERTGISRRTSQRWLRSEWWPGVEAEARSRWMGRTLAKARGAVERGAGEDHKFAHALLERAGEMDRNAIPEDEVRELVVALARDVLDVVPERYLPEIHARWTRRMGEHGLSMLQEVEVREVDTHERRALTEG